MKPCILGDPSLGLDRALVTLRDQPCWTAHEPISADLY
jgi:hypothetical protein